MTDDNAIDLIAALSPADRKRFESAMWDPDDPGRPYRLMLLLRSASPHERETFYAGLPGGGDWWWRYPVEAATEPSPEAVAKAEDEFKALAAALSAGPVENPPGPGSDASATAPNAKAEDDRVRLTLLLDTLRCPNTCQHCQVEEGGPPHRKSLTEIQALVDRLQTEADSAGVWLFRVYPGCKEPLAHPEFFEIDMFLANRFPRHNEAWTSERVVATNGWAIARDPKFLGRLIRHRPRLNRIQLTLGELGEKHDRFAGRKGAFADIELAAKRALVAGMHICWIYVMHRGNIERIPAMSNWVHTLEPVPDESIFLVKPQVAGRALGRLRRHDLDRLPPRFRRMLGGGRTESELVAALRKDQYNEIESDHLQHYCPNSWDRDVMLEIEHNGDVYPFCHEHHPAFLLGNIGCDPLSVILDRYRRNAVPAQHARRVLGLQELAAKHGRPDGDELHDLCSICRTLVCRHLGIQVDAGFDAGRDCHVGNREESLHEEVKNA
jgi:MoaA/NifB/PqqE/SkfB family radical SAM enzyme